jgi:hypothetical protein
MSKVLGLKQVMQRENLAGSPDFVEETITLPVDNPRVSVLERNIERLQRIVPEARPPANDPIA